MKIIKLSIMQKRANIFFYDKLRKKFYNRKNNIRTKIFFNTCNRTKNFPNNKQRTKLFCNSKKLGVKIQINLGVSIFFNNPQNFLQQQKNKNKIFSFQKNTNKNLSLWQTKWKLKFFPLKNNKNWKQNFFSHKNEKIFFNNKSEKNFFPCTRIFVITYFQFSYYNSFFSK